MKDSEARKPNGEVAVAVGISIIQKGLASLSHQEEQVESRSRRDFDFISFK